MSESSRTGARISILCFLAVLFATFATSRRAEAAPWVNRELNVSVVYARTVPLTVGTQHVFRTWSASGDTVLHLWSVWSPATGWGTEVASNDDYSGLGLNSRISYTPGWGEGPFTLIARNYSYFGTGNARIMQCSRNIYDDADKCDEAATPGQYPKYPSNWTDLAVDYPVRGTWIFDIAKFPYYPGYDYQTAPVNPQLGGTNDTVLLGVNADGYGHLVAFDDDSGVDYMSRIAFDSFGSGASANITNLIVAGWESPGKVNVYANDRALWDYDGDGLGIDLEFALGTCDIGTPSSPPLYPSQGHCNGRPTTLLHDSDRDGLLDSEELFGIDDPITPQLLPAWGADPLRKDMFFEQDWVTRPTCPVPNPPAGSDELDTDCWNPAVSGNPFTEAMAEQMRDFFASASATEVQNIAGTGIGIHIDIGSNCSVANATLCGNWGGGGWEIPLPLGADWTPFIDPIRRNTRDPVSGAGHAARFRYVPVHPSGGQTGLGPLVVAGINGFAPLASHTPRAIVHELGHAMGLEHSGLPSRGDVNCKPNYPSIMSYAVTGFGFSHGNISTVLDPGMIKETNAFFPVSATYLAPGSSQSSFGFPVADVLGNVDFNRSKNPAIYDGTLGFVRAGATHGRGGCAAATVLTSDVEKKTLNDPSLARVTPAMAIWAGRIWVFWVEGNAIKYRSTGHTGANPQGSCENGSGSIGETDCNTWEPSLAMPPGDLSVQTTDEISGISVITTATPTANDERLLVAYSTRDPMMAPGKVYVAWSSPAGSPTLTWTTPPPGLPIASNVRDNTEIELSFMYVDPVAFPTYPASVLVSLFLVEEQPGGGGKHVWYWTTDATPLPASWSRRQVLDAGSNWLSARRVAGVTTWPNRAEGAPHRSDIGFACGIFPIPKTVLGDARDTARFGCYDKATDNWTLGGARTSQYAGRKASITFHTLRETTQSVVQPLGNDLNNLRGQFWYSAVLSGRNDLSGPMASIWASREVRPDAPPGIGMTCGGTPVVCSFNDDLNFGLIDEVWDDWTTSKNLTGVPLRETLDVSALKGVILYDYIFPGEQVEFSRIRFLPFADGTFHAQLRDLNDFHVMERGICLGLNGAPSIDDVTGPCGPKNIHGF